MQPPTPTPVLHPHPHLCSFFLRSDHCYDLGLPQPSVIDLIIITIMRKVTLQEHLCVFLCAYVQCGSSSEVLSASSWRFNSSFCLVLSSPLQLISQHLKPSYLLRPTHLLQADFTCDSTLVLLYGFLPWLIRIEKHLSSRRIDDPYL